MSSNPNPESIAEIITYVPGMREQGEGIECHVDSDHAPLKACMVENPTAVYIPDLGTWEIQNLYAHSPDEVKAYLRKYAGKDMKAVGRDTYKSTQESSPCSV